MIHCLETIDTHDGKYCFNIFREGDVINERMLIAIIGFECYENMSDVLTCVKENDYNIIHTWNGEIY